MISMIGDGLYVCAGASNPVEIGMPHSIYVALTIDDTIRLLTALQQGRDGMEFRCRVDNDDILRIQPTRNGGAELTMTHDTQTRKPDAFAVVLDADQVVDLIAHLGRIMLQVEE